MVAALAACPPSPETALPLGPQPLVKFNSQEHLFHEGDETDALYEIVSGVVVIYRVALDGSRQIHGLRYAGEFVGIGYGRTYGVSAVAVRPTTVRRLPKAMLERAIEETPHLARRLLEVCTDELMRTSDQLMVISNRIALGRVAACLLDIHERAAGGGDTIILPITRSEMGDLLGLTIETVSRAMTRLKSLGIIALPRSDTVIVRDRDAMRALAEGDGTGAARGRLCA